MARANESHSIYAPEREESSPLLLHEDGEGLDVVKPEQTSIPLNTLTIISMWKKSEGLFMSPMIADETCCSIQLSSFANDL